MRNLDGKFGDLLVELGISRFKPFAYEEAETSERLVLLALFDLFARTESVDSDILHVLKSAHTSSQGIALEWIGAFLLARAFSLPRPLSDVFDFVGECKIKDEPAELVTVEKVNNSFKYTRLDTEFFTRSSPIGCSPNPEGVLEWLKDPKGFTFCFPPTTVGPDLLLMLRLTKYDTIIPVCIQFQNIAQLDREGRESAILKTDPNNWFSKDYDLLVRNELVRAIQNLGTCADESGKYTALRVVFTHPPLADTTDLDKAVREAPECRVATLDVSKLEPEVSQFGRIFQGLCDKMVKGPGRKRRRDEDFDASVGRAKAVPVQCPSSSEPTTKRCKGLQ
jgi:hypothetical protein